MRKWFGFCLLLLQGSAIVADTRDKLIQQDLIIVFDRAQDYKNFALTKRVATSLLQYASISPATTRVGLVTFDYDAHVISQLNETTNRECVVQALDRITHVAAWEYSNLAKGVKKAWMMCQTHERFTVKTRKDGSIYSTQTPVKQIIMVLSSRDTVMHFIDSMNAISLINVQLIFLILGKKVSHEAEKILKKSSRKAYVFSIANKNDINENFLSRVRQTNVFQGSFTKCSGGRTQYYDECKRRCRCHNGRLVDCFRVRKDFTLMKISERARYLQVFRAFSSDPHFRPLYSTFTRIHGNYFCKGIHTKPYFLPWHRCYLLMIENLLRRIDCSITIPYWDWGYYQNVAWKPGIHIWGPGDHELGTGGHKNKTSCVLDGPFAYPGWQVPDWLNNSDVMKSVYGPAYQAMGNEPPCLRRTFASDVPGFELVIRSLTLIANEVESFQTIMILVFHNLVHDAIGGNMAYMYSSVTPEFYFHHGYLDMIWDAWQSRDLEQRYAYFTGLKSPMLNLECPYSQAQMVDAFDLPGCVKVRYVTKKTAPQKSKQNRDQHNETEEKWQFVNATIFSAEHHTCFGFSNKISMVREGIKWLLQLD